MSDTKSIHFVWSNYIYQTVSIDNLKQQTLDSLANPHTTINPIFEFKSYDEINQIFEETYNETETLTCFNLVASAEANIKMFFFTKNRKNRLGRELHKVKRSKKNKAKLHDDILKLIASNEPHLKKPIYRFGELLAFRHWIAHGRYWERKGKKIYTAEITYAIVEDLLIELSNINKRP